MDLCEIGNVLSQLLTLITTNQRNLLTNKGLLQRTLLVARNAIQIHCILNIQKTNVYPN